MLWVHRKCLQNTKHSIKQGTNLFHVEYYDHRIAILLLIGRHIDKEILMKNKRHASIQNNIRLYINLLYLSSVFCQIFAENEKNVDLILNRRVPYSFALKLKC